MQANWPLRPDIFVQYNYQYFMQELVHDGQVMDLKFNAQFGWLASVSNGSPQVSQLLNTAGGGYHFNLMQP